MKGLKKGVLILVLVIATLSLSSCILVELLMNFDAYVVSGSSYFGMIAETTKKLDDAVKQRQKNGEDLYDVYNLGAGGLQFAINTIDPQISGEEISYNQLKADCQFKNYKIKGMTSKGEKELTISGNYRLIIKKEGTSSLNFTCTNVKGGDKDYKYTINFSGKMKDDDLKTLKLTKFLLNGEDKTKLFTKYLEKYHNK